MAAASFEREAPSSFNDLRLVPIVKVLTAQVPTVVATFRRFNKFLDQTLLIRYKCVFSVDLVFKEELNLMLEVSDF